MPDPKQIKQDVLGFIRETEPGLQRMPKAPRQGWWLAAVFLALIVLGFQIANTVSNPDAVALRGKILSPKDGVRLTSRHITVTGYTENVPPEYPWVMVAVDVPNLGLFWPKQPFIKSNTRFQIQYHEGGPEGPCTISLYLLSHDYQKQVSRWLNDQRQGGLPILPEKYRLDSITTTTL